MMPRVIREPQIPHPTLPVLLQQVEADREHGGEERRFEEAPAPGTTRGRGPRPSRCRQRTQTSSRSQPWFRCGCVAATAPAVSGAGRCHAEKRSDRLSIRRFEFRTSLLLRLRRIRGVRVCRGKHAAGDGCVVPARSKDGPHGQRWAALRRASASRRSASARRLPEPDRYQRTRPRHPRSRTNRRRRPEWRRWVHQVDTAGASDELLRDPRDRRRRDIRRRRQRTAKPGRPKPRCQRPTGDVRRAQERRCPPGRSTRPGE